jgi:hypothetical protein
MQKWLPVGASSRFSRQRPFQGAIVMTKTNSTAPRPPRKPRPPKKPFKDFPLTPHRNGLWCKKIRARVDGKTLDPKMHYFGSWRDDPKGTRALDKWLKEKDDLLAGRVPRARAAAGGKTLGGLVEQFLVSKADQQQYRLADVARPCHQAMAVRTLDFSA